MPDSWILTKFSLVAKTKPQQTLRWRLQLKCRYCFIVHCRSQADTTVMYTRGKPYLFRTDVYKVMAKILSKRDLKFLRMVLLKIKSFLR
jgi:hypothetical protein